MGRLLSEILEDVDADQAARHPIENAHSIWELVLHAAAWAEEARASLESGETHLSDEENFPPVLASEPSTWEAAKRRPRVRPSRFGGRSQGSRGFRTVPHGSRDELPILPLCPFPRSRAA